MFTRMMFSGIWGRTLNLIVLSAGNPGPDGPNGGAGSGKILRDPGGE